MRNCHSRLFCVVTGNINVERGGVGLMSATFLESLWRRRAPDFPFIMKFYKASCSSLKQIFSLSR